MEILGEGKDNIGGVWAAQRIPDDHVGVSCNIPRIGRLQRGNTEYFMCSDNIESVARRYGLWDGKGEFIFWKAFNASYANGKNFREREYFILNALAPSLELTMDMDELPFSIRPDQNVDVRKVIDLLRSTYEGTDLDMCQNVKMPVTRKDKNGKPYTDTITSPIANPWLTSAMQQTLNNIAPGTITFRRTVSVAWCSYSFVAQLRDWLPDCVGGVCWMSVDNPGQSPRVPIFCGNSELPQPYSICGHKDYNPDAILWKYRRANKLATVAWQRTKGSMNAELKRLEDNAFARLEVVEREAARYDRLGRTDDMRATLNNFTRDQYENTSYAWSQLEAKYWQMFGMGF
jgi:dipeptidase